MPDDAVACQRHLRDCGIATAQRRHLSGCFGSRIVVVLRPEAFAAERITPRSESSTTPRTRIGIRLKSRIPRKTRIISTPRANFPNVAAMDAISRVDRCGAVVGRREGASRTGRLSRVGSAWCDCRVGEGAVGATTVGAVLAVPEGGFCSMRGCGDAAGAGAGWRRGAGCGRVLGGETIGADVGGGGTALVPSPAPRGAS